MQRAGLQIRGKNAAGFQKGSHDAEETANSCASWVQNDCCEHESSHPALDAEEMPFSSASRQQNMHFDLKSVLDAEDMSVSSAS